MNSETNKINSKPYSLRRRLLTSATVLLLLFLGAMAWVLNSAFEKSVLANASDALKNQIFLLMANVELEGDRIVMPATLSEPRLSQAESDLFAQIVTDKGDILWKSESLLDTALPLDSNPVKVDAGSFTFSKEYTNELYGMRLGVIWEAEKGDLPFTVQFAEKNNAYKKRLRGYQQQVAIWLLILGLALLGLLLGLLNWVLKPLVKVSTQVAQIEQGDRQRFDENYPIEVSRLTQNLNQLLNFEQQRIDRHKDVLGNLAHSLKTPIAVLKGISYAQKNQDEAHLQLGAMQNIIDYQLQSASAVGRRRFAKPIDITEPTQQLINSLQKLHRSKSLEVRVNIASNLLFYGDKGDWMELAGNLLDNAFKWAESRVSIYVDSVASSSSRAGLRLIVEDDGPGIDQELKSTILQRGVRLDTQTPGHGLGLHIVKGIVEAYEGELSLEDSSGGGTRFSVLLN